MVVPLLDRKSIYDIVGSASVGNLHRPIDVNQPLPTEEIHNVPCGSRFECAAGRQFSGSNGQCPQEGFSSSKKALDFWRHIAQVCAYMSLHLARFTQGQVSLALYHWLQSTLCKRLI